MRIAVINQKGGVGKTACAYNLAYNFAQLNYSDKRTILIDLDPSANATKGFNFIADHPTIVNSHHLLLSNVNLESAISQVYDNLYIVPSTIKLALAQRELNSKAFRETLLEKKLKYYDMNFIIDCSPTLSDLTINAIYAADFLLIPVTYEDDALEGLADLFSVINEIKEKQQFCFKILRNQKDARKTKTNEYIESKLADFIGKDAVCRTIIRQDEAINQAKIERQPISIYKPHSTGAQDFNLLALELLQIKMNLKEKGLL